MKRSNRGNWSLIGILAAAVIIGIVIFFMFSGGTGTSTVKKDSKLVDQSSQKQTIYGKAIDTGKGVDCREHLNQIRSGIQNYKISSPDNANPPTMNDIGLGVAATYFECPVSHQPYIYDPATGTVRCQYPGHASY